jgi:hypothetical protein
MVEARFGRPRRELRAAEFAEALLKADQICPDLRIARRHSAAYIPPHSSLEAMSVVRIRHWSRLFREVLPARRRRKRTRRKVLLEFQRGRRSRRYEEGRAV